MAKTYQNRQLPDDALVKDTFERINNNSNEVNADLTDLYAKDTELEGQLTNILNETDLDPNKDPEVTNARTSNEFGLFDTVKLRLDNTDSKVTESSAKP
jgi:hypothetical protein